MACLGWYISSQLITVLFVRKIFISCLSETFKHSGLVILDQDIFSSVQLFILLNVWVNTGGNYLDIDR